MPGKSRGPRPSTGRFLVPGLLVLAPFAYLWALVCPRSSSLALYVSNDFPTLYYSYKAYLVSALLNGTFPRWSPGEACGYPFYCSPFAAAFYPLNLLALGWAKLTGSYDFVDHQRFTVLGISIYLAGAYAWLRSLGLGRFPAAAGALLSGLGFRMTEIVRFTNAVHTVCWYPYLLWGMTLAGLRGQARAGFWLVFGASVMALTAGYPYYVYYLVFVVPPYFLLLRHPAVRTLFSAEADAGWKRSALASGAAYLAAGVLASPYLYKMQWMLAQTAGRSGRGLDWASGSFSLLDILGSWIYPPASLGEGWYYFGMAGSLLVAAHALSLALLRHPRPERVLMALLGAWFLGVSAIAYGTTSPLFLLLWYVLPGFATLREWSRLNIVLTPAIALAVALAAAWMQDWLSGKPEAGQDPARTRRFLWAFGLLCAGVLAAQAALFWNETFNNQWLHFHARGVFSAWLPMLAGVLASGVLAGLAWLRLRGIPGRRVLLGAVLALAAITTLDLGWTGSRQWAQPFSGEWLSQFTLEGPAPVMRAQGFVMPRICEYNTLPMWTQYNAGVVNDWYYARYVDLFRKYWDINADSWGPNQLRQQMDPEDHDAMIILLGMHNGMKLFFTQSVDHAAPLALIKDAVAAGPAVRALEITAYDGDRLEFTATVAVDGYITYVDNWDPDWVAWVDGRKVEMKKALGAFKSVHLAPGAHTVRLAYVPYSAELPFLAR